MKIALSTSGHCLGSPVESRFGRASRFIIYDLEKEIFEVLDNKVNMNAPQGAGVQAAANVLIAEVKVVITGHCGPKAFNLLKNAGVSVYLAEGISVSEAIKLYQSNSLKKQESADVDGHWQ
ncbi:MAG TPA: dinitrogenase iron-molybdenum cofactor biosynthesis protein [Lentisphaeria bacterium]|nr:MAG: dinitrogenase iron-molybdenum cofactor biosynthesis protein [Lentisphaerae bacterium GWF2_49_21]HBC89800.1 dinitrogenase iron-molybdenum cofactor biosynthesis protein [Lentisphaeria bacterium]